MTCKGIDLVGFNRKQDIKHGQCMYEVCISARLIRKTACMEKVLTYSGCPWHPSHGQNSVSTVYLLMDTTCYLWIPRRRLSYRRGV